VIVTAPLRMWRVSSSARLAVSAALGAARAAV